jgi:hypothetical protein
VVPVAHQSDFIFVKSFKFSENTPPFSLWRIYLVEYLGSYVCKTLITMDGKGSIKHFYFKDEAQGG